VEKRIAFRVVRRRYQHDGHQETSKNSAPVEFVFYHLLGKSFLSDLTQSFAES
jgi:hypothetical protein